MPDVESQLQAYWSQIVREHPPITAEDVIAPPPSIVRPDQPTPSAAGRKATDEAPDTPVQTAPGPPTRGARGPRWARPALVAATAVALVGAVLVGLSLRGAGDGAVPAGEPSRPADVEQALATANALGAAIRDHDVAAALDLFAEGTWVTVAQAIQTRFAMPLEDYAEILVYFDAQDALHTSWACEPDEPGAVEPSLEQGVTVTCRYATSDAVVRAVDAAPIPAEVTLVVGADGIREYDEVTGAPTVHGPFKEWMEEHHRGEVALVGIGGWASRDEAAEAGRLLRERASEWAQDLADSGCTLENLHACDPN